MKNLIYYLILFLSLSASAQVKVVGSVEPNNSADTYPTHKDIYGEGGMRTVATIIARDAITSDRRKELMLVGVIADQKIYQLKGGITNTDWVEFSSGLSVETDPVFGAHVSAGITGTNITNWNTAFGWGNHASAGYSTASNTQTFTNKSGNISQWTNDSGYFTSINSGQVTTALGFTPYNATNPAGYITGLSFSALTGKPTTLSGYGITDAYPLTGNPSGFLTSFSETDPVYSTSSWFSTTNNSANWNTAYSQTRQWDGGATGLTAATGRTSLGLVIGTDVLAQRTFGTAANNNTGDFALFNANTYIGTTLNALNRASGAQTLTGVSIDGNAATATLAANSTLWNGQTYNSTPSTSGTYLLGFSPSDNHYHDISIANVKTTLGLGSNAYTSTAYLPLVGGTLTGGLTGTTATFKLNYDYLTPAVAPLIVGSASSPNKYASMGFDTSIDAFVISSLDFGTAYKNILLAPNGGNVGIGTSSARVAATGGNVTLDIKGGIYFGSSNAESTVINNDDSFIINFDADNNGGTDNFFRIAKGTTQETGGTELFKIASSGAITGISATLAASRSIITTGNDLLFANSSGAHNIIFGDNNVRYYSLYTPSGAATGSIRNFSTSTDILTWTAAGALTAANTITAPTFYGQLDGTISSGTTATTQAPGTNNGTVATMEALQAAIAGVSVATVYTPTFTLGGNITSVTDAYFSYERIGNRVNIHGKLLANPPAAGNSDFLISLPSGQTSNFTNDYDVLGLAVSTSSILSATQVSADVTNDKVKVQFTASTNTFAMIHFSYSYIVQ